MTREWFCYEHARIHDDAEQAWYCQDGEWRETSEPERSEFATRWDEVFQRARDQHPEQILATIRALGTCTRDEVAMTETTDHPEHLVTVEPVPYPGWAAKPVPAASAVRRWRDRRACRRRGGHWWHPADAMIAWFCCQCGAERDGMPEDGT